MENSCNPLPMPKPMHARTPARVGRGSHRDQTADRRQKASQPQQLSKDMSRLAARVAYLESVLGLAEEPVRIIRIG